MLPKEYTWFLKHPESVAQYSGEYIAIVGEEIVAHGKNFKAVFRAAEKRGTPYIHKVPRADRELVV